MKATATQYAKTLYELTKNKNHKEIDEVVSGLVSALRRNGETRKIKEIAGKFGEIFNKENGIIEARIISREEISKELRNKLLTYVSNKYDAKEVILNSIVDKNVKGGIIIRVGDEITDGSVGRKLEDLRKELVR